MRAPVSVALVALVVVVAVAVGGGVVAGDDVAVGGGVAAGDGATTQADASRSLQTGPTLTVSDARLAPGETAVLRVNLTAAPDGVAGFDATVTVADGAVVELTDASLASEFGLANATVVSETTVRLRGADTEGSITATDDPVTVARVTVRAVEPGTTSLTPTGQFDSDEGSRLGVENEAGSVRVTAATTTADDTPTPTAVSTTDGTTTTGSDGATRSDDTTTSGEETTGSSGEDATEPSGEETATTGPGLGVVAAVLALVAFVGLRRRQR